MRGVAKNVRTLAYVRTCRYTEDMKVTATQLRANIYAILDQILATGESVDIERHGRIIRLQPVPNAPRMAVREAGPPYIIGNPDDLVELDWSQEWSELQSSASTPTSSLGSSTDKRKSSAKTRGR
jgi:antitoxin (DNA-binding transcriptional repressor) of toxin-antitoxin stability system